MPRVMDLTEELKLLEDQHRDDPTGRLNRQYVLRLPLAYAIKFIMDCIDQEKQPGHLLRDIVEDHYDGIDRDQVLLSDYATRLVGAICRETGLSPDDAVNTLLTAIGPDYLQKLRQSRSTVQQ